MIRSEPAAGGDPEALRDQKHEVLSGGAMVVAERGDETETYTLQTAAADDGACSAA